VAFLRSSFLLPFVCLLVLTGYTVQLFDDCCESRASAKVEQVKASKEQKQPDESHHCECLCHQIFTASGSTSVTVTRADLVAVELLVCVNEFPPDALPLGIDYPPQLS